MCVSETSELTEKQLSAQTENKRVDGSQATKNMLEDGSTETVRTHWAGLEKKQMDEA